ncbi:MAG TPA: nucleoside-diphosphate kinase, partial [Streptosporangiaceae bacterium]|nr:nucleoside-diphosphate kinase [Streptosporangiaceae bacterium]
MRLHPGSPGAGRIYLPGPRPGRLERSLSCARPHCGGRSAPRGSSLSNDTGVERTLVLLKPDAVARGLVGRVITRFEEALLKIVAAKMV